MLSTGSSADSAESRKESMNFDKSVDISQAECKEKGFGWGYQKRISKNGEATSKCV